MTTKSKFFKSKGIKFYYKRNQVGSGIVVLKDGSCYYLPPYLKIVRPVNNPSIIAFKLEKAKTITRQLKIESLESFEKTYQRIIDKMEKVGLLKLRHVGRSQLSDSDCVIEKDFFQRYDKVDHLMFNLINLKNLEREDIFGKYCIALFKEGGIWK